MKFTLLCRFSTTIREEENLSLTSALSASARPVAPVPVDWAGTPTRHNSIQPGKVVVDPFLPDPDG